MRVCALRHRAQEFGGAHVRVHAEADERGVADQRTGKAGLTGAYQDGHTADEIENKYHLCTMHAHTHGPKLQICLHDLRTHFCMRAQCMCSHMGTCVLIQSRSRARARGRLKLAMQQRVAEHNTASK